MTVRSLQICEEGSLVVAEQRDDAAARRRGLLAKLIEAKDHADAVAPPVDVIAQDDQQLSRLCAVPDDAVFALALDEIRNHEELIELFQPPMDVADRPERVEIGAKLLGGERHPGRGRRKRTGRLRARRACREASSKDDRDRALHCRSIPPARGLQLLQPVTGHQRLSWTTRIWFRSGTARYR